MIPLYDTIPSRTPPVATWLLIGVHVLVFMFEISLPESALIDAVFTFGMVPAELTSGPPAPYWTLFTCIFLHGGWGHLIANMWTLWIFGDNVEDRMGPVRFVVFYLLCGAAAAGAELLVSPTSTVPVIGASGAIAGIMGAYLAMFHHARIVLLVPLLFWPLFVQVSALFFLFYWLFIQVMSGSLSLDPEVRGGVAYWAHVGGFVVGLALHRLFVARARAVCDDEGPLECAWEPPRRGRHVRI
ncbi:MAG TPA: rhomboid family intramembrane serine protease [Nannocystis sp.]